MRGDMNLLYKQVNDLISSKLCIKLHELADSIGIDRRKIEGALRERYGYGFREFKNQARQKRINKLLAEKRISIKDIAIKMGVTPNALSRFIRTRMGKCSRELRNNHGMSCSKES